MPQHETHEVFCKFTGDYVSLDIGISALVQLCWLLEIRTTGSCQDSNRLVPPGTFAFHKRCAFIQFATVYDTQLFVAAISEGSKKMGVESKDVCILDMQEVGAWIAYPEIRDTHAAAVVCFRLTLRLSHRLIHAYEARLRHCLEARTKEAEKTHELQAHDPRS